MKNIRKIVTTDTDGNTETFVGTGFLMQNSAQEKSLHGGMAKIIGTNVTAHLYLPAVEDKPDA